MLKELQAQAAAQAAAQQQQQPGQGAPPQPLTPEQIAALEKDKQLLSMPLKEEELKGKVDIKYYGHAGIKISFKDE